ncbi:MAG: entericidin A/B family lipoprotein [Pseudomonadota bacterium]|nr:entericidin A/B family lipoprotein [Pseudomonadota bacterium]
MKKMTLLVLGLAIALAGCNTVRGAGEDISAGGQDISGAAQHTKHEMHEHSDDNGY